MWLRRLISLGSFWKNHSIYSSWNCKLRKVSGRLSIGNCTCHPPQGVHTPLLGQSASDSKGSMKFRSSSWGFKAETKATKATEGCLDVPRLRKCMQMSLSFLQSSSQSLKSWKFFMHSCVESDWVTGRRKEGTNPQKEWQKMSERRNDRSIVFFLVFLIDDCYVQIYHPKYWSTIDN